MQELTTVTINLTLIDLLSVVSRDEDERKHLWDLKIRQRAAKLALAKDNSYDEATQIILRDISRDPNKHENIRHPCKAWEAIAHGRKNAKDSLAEESTEEFNLKAYFKLNVWNYCVQQLKLEFTVTIDGFEDKLQHYVGHANLNVTGDPDKFSIEIARLNSNGFTAQLLGKMHCEYPDDCERMQLPKQVVATNETAAATESINQDSNEIASVDTVDDNGYVETPRDPSIYMPVKDINNMYTPLDMQFTPMKIAAITKNFADNAIRWTRPKTKRDTPNQRRLNIHFGDWTKYIKTLVGYDKEGFPRMPEREYESRKKNLRSPQ